MCIIVQIFQISKFACLSKFWLFCKVCGVLTFWGFDRFLKLFLVIVILVFYDWRLWLIFLIFIDVYDKVGVNAAIEYLFLGSMCLLIHLLFAIALLLERVSWTLHRFKCLCSSHRISKSSHIRIQCRFTFLNWLVIILHKLFSSFLFDLWVDFPHHFHIGSSHCGSKALLLSYVILQILSNFKQFLKLIHLLTTQLSLIKSIKLLQLT